MMTCDMGSDCTSRDPAPMCASVCPSQALWFGTREQCAATRPGVLAGYVALVVFGLTNRGPAAAWNTPTHSRPRCPSNVARRRHGLYRPFLKRE